jgi:hypothetical protein
MKNVQSINTIGINRKLTTEAELRTLVAIYLYFFHPVIFFKPVSMMWMSVVGFGFHFSAHPVSVGT